VSLLLKSLSKASKKHEAIKVQKPLVEDRKTVAAPVEHASTEEDSQNIEIDEQEERIQRRILHNRTKLLWPGIWTLSALTGTYGAFAYLSATHSDATEAATTELPEQTRLPQTWYLTPEVIREGVKAGWKELDKLTIGIVIATVAIHFMKKSPLPFWEKLVHITGEKKYTAFT